MPAAPKALQRKLATVLAQGLLAADAPVAPPSPCIGVCRLDAYNTSCEGCLRTLEELRVWGSAHASQQRQIWLRIQQRCQSSN
ncbi:MAG: DUF1289 domain-containing protein [Comamonas sp.]